MLVVQCEIAILDHLRSGVMGDCHSVTSRCQSAKLWNCHSWSQDVSSNVKLTVSWGGPLDASSYVKSAKFWCSGIASTNVKLLNSWPLGLSSNVKVCFSWSQDVVYLYSRHCHLLYWGGVGHPSSQSSVFLPSVCVLVFKVSMLVLTLGVHLAKVGLSANFGVAGMQGISALLPTGMAVEQPGDLPRSALTTILHITAGKYEPS